MGSSRDERIDELLHFAASRPGAFARVECLACAPIQRDALADDRCTVLGNSRPTVRATIAGAISRTVSEAVYFSGHGRNSLAWSSRCPSIGGGTAALAVKSWWTRSGGAARPHRVGRVRMRSECRTPSIAAGPGGRPPHNARTSARRRGQHRRGAFRHLANVRRFVCTAAPLGGVEGDVAGGGSGSAHSIRAIVRDPAGPRLDLRYAPRAVEAAVRVGVAIPW